MINLFSLALFSLEIMRIIKELMDIFKGKISRDQTT